MTEPNANRILEEYLHDLLCESEHDDVLLPEREQKTRQVKADTEAQFEAVASENDTEALRPDNSKTNTLPQAQDTLHELSGDAIKVEAPRDAGKRPAAALKDASFVVSSANSEASQHIRCASAPVHHSGAATTNWMSPRPNACEILPQESRKRSQQQLLTQPQAQDQDHQNSQDAGSETSLEEIRRQKLQDMLNRRTGENLRSKLETKIRVDVDPPNLALETPAYADPAPVTEASPALAPASEALMAWGENGRPLWAEGSFEVLLFEVSGLSLAVPLVALGQIVPMSEKLTVLQGQSDWFMGILPSQVGDIRCVNTALFVMPERYNESFLASAKYVVTIDGMPWGLAVDSVKQPITLSPEDVKWRSQRSQRPWLAGTVKSHMCALIDIPQMGELLQRADKNYRPKEK